MKPIYLITLIVLVFGTVSDAMASIPLRFSLGAGAVVKNNIRYQNQYKKGSDSLFVSAIPLLQISYGPIFIGQQGLNLSFIGNRERSAYLNINRGGDRYDGLGMVTRQSSWFAGVGAKWDKFNFLLSKDINGRSHGVRTSFSYTEIYTIKEKFFTRSSLSVEFLNRDFAEYYYGVRSSEANPSRPEYHPGTIINPSISFFPGYKFNEKLSSLIGVSVKYLHSDIINSPTTKNDQFELSLITGLLWQL